MSDEEQTPFGSTPPLPIGPPPAPPFPDPALAPEAARP